MNYYVLNIIESGLRFKIGYKKTKLNKIEHLAGKLNKGSYIDLHNIIPNEEERIPVIIKNRSKEIVFEKITKESTKSLYRDLLAIYYYFYEKKFNIAPRINAIEGKSLKMIIAFLRKICADDAEVKATFEAILLQWHKLPDFYQNQADLKQINSNLNTILRQLKNGQNNKKASDDLRDSF